MTVASRLRKLRRAVRAVGTGAVSLLLAGVVFASVTQAGRTYLYCRVMRTVMSHACCQRAAHDRTLQAASALWAPECCQARSAASLEACTPSARATESVAPASSVALPVLLTAAIGFDAPEACLRDATLRAGPPKLRTHARLMVFHI
ncbi:MAG TPA: hypothetical protein VJR89_43775 [Polyangiales bacterium]|nr:hypothetical protein [Polyangiales bacterium]